MTDVLRRSLVTVLVCGSLSGALIACGGDEGTTATAATAVATAQGDASTGEAAAVRAAAKLPAGILGRPTGNASPDRPRAVVLIMHGGGWAASTKETLRVGNLGTDGYRADGFATYAVPMAAGRGALDSAKLAYRRMRDRFGSKVPICALGVSSGGHVALMLAADRNIACVIANAAPTDLPSWTGESPGQAGYTEGFFGRGASLRRWSPTSRASRIKARVLLQYASNDTDVPADQGRRFLKAHPRRTSLVVLDPGTEAFAHSNVDAGQLDQVYPRNERFFDAAARAAGR
jgi:acetyl esterase/lipase